MMHRKYLYLSIIIITCLFAGCAEPPRSPISSIPHILIDYVEETEETKVYVHGIEDTFFSNITICINQEMKTENFTYSLHMATEQNNFILNITVWDEEKDYQYDGNITIFAEDNEWLIKVVDLKDEGTREGTLPYTIIMERRE
jgi:hypothetical protein